MDAEKNKFSIPLMIFQDNRKQFLTLAARSILGSLYRWTKIGFNSWSINTMLISGCTGLSGTKETVTMTYEDGSPR